MSQGRGPGSTSLRLATLRASRLVITTHKPIPSGHGRPEHGNPGDVSSGTGAEDPRTQVEVKGQGIQVGDHGIQHNIYLSDRRIDGEMFKTLNPHAAADQVRLMHHDDAAALLATASAGVSAEVLKVLLPADAPLVVTLLSRINRRKAEELVAEVIHEAPWLGHLPAATEAIARCETGMRQVLGDKVEQLAREGPSRKDTQGYCQIYDHGIIFWSSRVGAQPITGDILKYYNYFGGIKGQFGFPLTPEAPTQPSPAGTTGSCQRFESYSDYGSAACERLGLTYGGAVYSSAHGVHATWGNLGECYELEGGSGGWLGFPITEIEAVPAEKKRTGIFRRKIDIDPSRTLDPSRSYCQRFEGGAIYCKSKFSPIAVRPQVDAYMRRRGLHKPPGFPVGREVDAVKSPYGSTGRAQEFEGDGRGRALIYTSKKYGAHCVEAGMLIFYRQEGETRSWLGFPTGEPRRYTLRGRFSQAFEGGTIFWANERGAIAVPSVSMELISYKGGGSQHSLGFPITPEKRLESEGIERIQFFENGVVTVRRGVAEVWWSTKFVDEVRRSASG